MATGTRAPGVCSGLSCVRPFRADGGNNGWLTRITSSSCITKDNFHSPRCLFADYIKTLVARVGLDCREDTHISPVAEKRRKEGVYGRREGGGPSARRDA